MNPIKNYLVTFVYTDNAQMFMEHVAMTSTQAKGIRQHLLRAQKRGTINDVYVSKEQQTTPTPFAEFAIKVKEDLNFI
jgi:hypothetical protein